jgi:hypothetical protein
MSTAIQNTTCSDAATVAAEMAAAYRGLVEYFRREYQLPPQEALGRADAFASPEYVATVLARPPQQASWTELQALAERDPTLAQRRWEQIKQAAREELRGKVRAGKALEGFGSDPRERAQFLALCEELADGWQPRNGVERQLLEMMAQAQTAMLAWLTRLSQWSSQPAKKDRGEDAGWKPPRVSEAEAIEQAAGMVERFQRLFSRALRALTELRRRPLAVVVQGAGQVNIGQQQVNVSP